MTNMTDQLHYSPEELETLIDLLRNEQLDAPNAQRLCQILESDRSARETYLKEMDLISSIWVHTTKEKLPPQTSDLSDTPAPYPIQTQHHQHGHNIFRSLGIAAAILFLILPAGYLSYQAFRSPVTPTTKAPPIYATIEHTREVTYQSGQSLPPQTNSLSTQAISIATGEMTLKFPKGAKVNIKAPARFSLLSDNSMRMTQGDLSAEVPKSAKGFRVITPEFSVVDLGTKFELSIQPERASSVQVTKGLVAITNEDQNADYKLLKILSIGEKIHLKSVNGKIQFAKRINIDVQNTGVDRASSKDKQWSIVAHSKDPTFKRQPATIRTHPRWVAKKDARWIAPTANPKAHVKSIFTYETRFTMPAADQADLNSARLELNFLVDNQVTAIRLNGQPFTVPVHDEKLPTTRFTAVILKDAFVHGENKLQIDVRNNSNVTGILAKLNGSVMVFSRDD